MNELTNTSVLLPDTIEDLSRFVLINEERIQSLRAEIRAIKKVNLAREVYEQKLAEAQEIGQITVEAAQKMGELLLQIQKQSGNQYTSATPTDAEKQKTKTEITAEMGMSSQLVSQYQQMAQNPEAVQAAIQKAIERGDVVSRSQVMKEIRAVKDQLAEKDRRISELENREPETVVREVRVVPDDYDKLKHEAKLAKAYERDFQTEKRKNEIKQQENLKLREENEELKRASMEGQDTENLSQNVYYFCTLANQFIGNVGGLVWLIDRISDMPQKERELFLKAARSFRDWANVFSHNLERSMNNE